MPKIQFRAKVRTVYNHDDSIAWREVKVPALERSHCDMHAFRASREFGSYANSDLFKNILVGIARKVAPHGFIRLDKIPENVTVDDSGFLALVTIDAQSWR